MAEPIIIVPRLVISPNEAIAEAKWAARSAYINATHYKPDIQALHVILACVTGQFDSQSHPIWMFLNGPSGSGKTAMGIEPMETLPNLHFIDNITAHTFMSGYIGQKNAGLMHRVGSSSILAFPDFTTFLSMREDGRKEAASHLRRMYDGELKPENGAMSVEPWKGKVTIIAAVTPIIERYWGLLRDMGDRFLQVRWPRLHGPSVARASRKQSGRKDEIKSRMIADTFSFFTAPAMNFKHIPELSDDQGDSADCMAELTCYLRTQVVRDVTGNREIRDVPQVEQTGRVGQCIPALARYSAVMFRREEVKAADMAISRRVSLDSMPYTRMRIMLAIPPKDPISAAAIIDAIQISESTLRWNMEELEALGIIKTSTNSFGTCYEMTPHIREMWLKAFPDMI